MWRPWFFKFFSPKHKFILITKPHQKMNLCQKKLKERDFKNCISYEIIWFLEFFTFLYSRNLFLHRFNCLKNTSSCSSLGTTYVLQIIFDYKQQKYYLPLCILIIPSLYFVIMIQRKQAWNEFHTKSARVITSYI